MISNPLSNALFLPTMVRIGCLLLAGALLVAVVEWRNLLHPRTIAGSTLFRRIFSWAVMAPTFALGVFAGGAPALVIVLYLSLQSVREFGRMTRMSRPYVAMLAVLVPITILVAAAAPGVFPYLPIAAFLVLSGFALLRGETAGSYRELTIALFGYLYLPVLLSFFVLIGRHMPHGTVVLLAVGMAVALSDVCAFTIGKLAGGPRLAPQISPNKTAAGALGNVLGAYAGFAVMAFALPASWPLALVAGLPALIAVASVWGDLLESLIKRTFAVKDTGATLPGFGGILDRIDSLIVAMPVTFFALRLAG